MFEKKKKDDFEELLQTQQLFQKDYENSQVKVRQSAEDLRRLVSEYEENADLITALAMFPLKSVDKKIAFVLGLALFFKVPFDVSGLVASQIADFSDVLTVVTQSALSVALLYHYGIIKALFVKR